MRIVVFGAGRRVGVWVGDQIIDVNGAFARSRQRKGDAPARARERADAQTPARLVDFIAVGGPAIEGAREAADEAIESPDPDFTFEVGTVPLHAPWPGRRIACAGGNYAAHLFGMVRHQPGHESDTIESTLESARAAGQWGFWKVPDSVAGPEDDVPFPSRCKYFDYEGEAAIVIGRRGKNIRRSDLESYVWGVTLLNDWSKRDRSSSPNRPMSFNTAKNFDRSTSLGPCIVVGHTSCADLHIETRVNGAIRQSYSTNGMIFDFGEILEHLSTDFTFVPGDIISGGTDAGTAADSSPPGPDGTRALDLFLKVGDVVEVSSADIGTLRNTVVEAG